MFSIVQVITFIIIILVVGFINGKPVLQPQISNEQKQIPNLSNTTSRLILKRIDEISDDHENYLKDLTCVCAVISSHQSDEGVPINAGCEAWGKAQCMILCNAIVQGAKAGRIHFICIFEVSIKSPLCGSRNSTYAWFYNSK